MAKVLLSCSLPSGTEDNLRSRAELFGTDLHVGLHLWAEMMVKEYARCMAGSENLCHGVDTVVVVEVYAKEQVSLVECLRDFLGMLVVADDGVSAGQPLQEIGIGIGHDDGRLLAESLTQAGGPGKA